MNDINQVLMLASVMSPVVFAVLEVVKKGVNLPKNLMPLIGLLLGVAIGSAFSFTDLPLDARLWAGGLAGLSSTGLFELLKNNPGGTKKD